MLSPEAAFKRIIDDNVLGFDDPTELANGPVRWFYDRNSGFLCRQGWRAHTIYYPDWHAFPIDLGVEDQH